MRLLNILFTLILWMPAVALSQTASECETCQTQVTPKCLRKCGGKVTNEDRIECMTQCKGTECATKCAPPPPIPGSDVQVIPKRREPRNDEEVCKQCLDDHRSSCETGCMTSKDGAACTKACLETKCSKLCYLPDSMSTNPTQGEVNPALCANCTAQAESMCAASKRCKAGVPGYEACKFRCEREACKTACDYAD